MFFLSASCFVLAIYSVAVVPVIWVMFFLPVALKCPCFHQEIPSHRQVVAKSVESGMWAGTVYWGRLNKVNAIVFMQEGEEKSWPSAGFSPHVVFWETVAWERSCPAAHGVEALSPARLCMVNIAAGKQTWLAASHSCGHPLGNLFVTITVCHGVGIDRMALDFDLCTCDSIDCRRCTFDMEWQKWRCMRANM